MIRKSVTLGHDEQQKRKTGTGSARFSGCLYPLFAVPAGLALSIVTKMPHVSRKNVTVW